MLHWRIKLSLFLNYFVFAILLNSVGTVILQVQSTYDISKSDASILEAFKDLSIAAVSFFVASYLTRIGYKKSMLIALAAVTLACLAMPFLPFFAMNKLLFAVVGASFALIKVSIYSVIGLVTKDAKEHASLMNFIESFFMVGILSGYFVFSFFIENQAGSLRWLQSYFVLAAISFVAFLLLWSAPLDESSVKPAVSKPFEEDFIEMFTLLVKPLVLIFICSVFLYVLIEQSIMTWLPTFNKEVIGLPDILSVQMASVLAGATALGRFLAGIVARKIHWFSLISSCLIAAAALVCVAIPLARGANGQLATGWNNVPLAAFVFPCIGLFLSPIYPAINSLILSNLPKEKHAAMAGLSVVFSALGGVFGSMITGSIFQHFGGEKAFYASILPISLLLVALFLFNKSVKKTSINVQ